MRRTCCIGINDVPAKARSAPVFLEWEYTL